MAESSAFEVFEHGFLASESMETLVELCDRDPMAQIVRKHFPEGSRVLEAGAGDGRWIVCLSRAGYKATGIEYSEKLCGKFNSAFPDLRMEPGDIRSMPFEDGSFDAVLSLGAIEHVPEGPEGCIREIGRVLRPGGKAILTVPNLALFQAGCHLARDAYHWVRFPQLRKGMRAIKSSARKGMYCFGVPTPGHEDIAFFEYRMSPRRLAEIVQACGLEVLEAFSTYPEAGVFNTMRSLGAHWRPGAEVELTWLGRIVRGIVPQTCYNHMAVAVCAVR